MKTKGFRRSGHVSRLVKPALEELPVAWEDNIIIEWFVRKRMDGRNKIRSWSEWNLALTVMNLRLTAET